MNIIVFDERSYLFESDDRVNECYLETSMGYMKDIYNTRGYVYLNEIYDHLGIAWNPHDTNTVFIKDDEHELSITFNHGVGSGPKWYVYVDHKIKKIES